MKQDQKHYQRVLTIAGSDSGAGAGIQADLKTFAALGCYGMSVVTAVTAQNTMGVDRVEALKPELVRAQFNAVIDDIGVDAVKIGVLANIEITEVIIECVAGLSVPIILDPVMIATSGDTLMTQSNLKLLRQLMKYCDLVTPNLFETSLLADHVVESREDMQNAAREILALGAQAVLVKGGHLADDLLADLFYQQDTSRWFEHKKIITHNTHGTGCTLSSAIAAFTAKGDSLELAIENAIDFLQGAIIKGKAYSLGKGHGPVHHFYKDSSLFA